MPRVICNLPNASNEINGIKFDEDRVSEEVIQELAELFASIPGYSIVDSEPVTSEPVAINKPGRPKKPTPQEIL